MTTREDPLVAGDEAEAVVRQRYSMWAQAGLQVAAGLAARPGGSPEWPSRPTDTGPARSPGERPLTTTAESARQRGWLVSASGPRNTGSGRMAGTAVAVKDIIDVAGLPTRNGSPGGRWRDPQISAPCWQALADAGAWCVGKAATHEMAWGVTTSTIPNPADPTRVPGGSSGGSAAVVAAGVAPAALGTDTGGSIRIPAALCGVVGLRPTIAAVSMAGVTPLAPAQDVVGPLADRVETAALLFELLSRRPVMPVNAEVTGMRIGYLARAGRLDVEVADGHQQTLSALADAGACLLDVDTVVLRHSASLSLLRMLTSSAALHGDDVTAQPSKYGSAARALLTLGRDLVDGEVLDHACAAVCSASAALFTDYDLDAVLTPMCPCLAPPRTVEQIDVGGKVEFVDAALTRYAAWAAVAGLPAIAVPSVSRSTPGISIQIVAPPDREDQCIRVALSIERIRLQRERA